MKLPITKRSNIGQSYKVARLKCGDTFLTVRGTHAFNRHRLAVFFYSFFLLRVGSFQDDGFWSTGELACLILTFLPSQFYHKSRRILTCRTARFFRKRVGCRWDDENLCDVSQSARPTAEEANRGMESRSAKVGHGNRQWGLCFSVQRYTSTPQLSG